MRENRADTNFELIQMDLSEHATLMGKLLLSFRCLEYALRAFLYMGDAILRTSRWLLELIACLHRVIVVRYIVRSMSCGVTSPMMQHSSEEERKAAYRESGRGVAVALIGFTLQAVSVLATSDESGGISTLGFTAFKERSGATLEELTFINAAGIWGESLAFSHEQKLDVESILDRLNIDRARIDKGKLKFGLGYLAENYRTAVLKIAQRLLRQKIINGIECGQIILAHRPIPEKGM